jgi:tetratricopeptide (TPR) repeat protein
MTTNPTPSPIQSSLTPVRIWEEAIILPTYSPPPPDPNPMFFEKRVNQGASGRVYPNPFTDHVNHETKIDQIYQAIFLENEYIQIMVMPQFGGRVHAALDKTNNYDFVYRQHVVKPALIGLFGSWLSGGMEFNWPLHHRPSTFMPVEYTIEKGEDGSATVWLSEHEPMNRMKGMLGVCVYPGKAFFEFKVQLYNRTPLPQPFLWWINCAVHVNENYQLIFPPDVESVTFHSRSSMASYPVARQLYAGCDWREGVDISWLKNVEPATSYFANPSRQEFFGGYDHGKQAGIIHIANRHVSPGKKCFTWGTGEFGTAWQASLTDSDGPYIELMASSYSDNQPDFSWLQPYEAKLFHHYWYPIQQIGAVKAATRKVAVNLENDFVGVCTTEAFPSARVLVTVGKRNLVDWQGDLLPGKPFTQKFSATQEEYPTILVQDGQGNELISYCPQPRRDDPLPEAARPPKLPEKIDSLEELYLTGMHVEQYLHFTLDPAPYWERALQLDPTDSRSNNALGRLLLRRGNFARAEELFRQSIQTLTQYNYNPYDGEPYYNLGLTLFYQGRYDEAYDAFYKGIWSYAWQAPGYYALAQIDVRRAERSGDYTRALDHLERSLTTNTHNTKAHDLKAAALRRMGRFESALQTAHETLAFDPLNHWARNELVLAMQALNEPTDYHQAELIRVLRGSAQSYLDLALDYSSAGLYSEAIDLLKGFLAMENTSTAPQAGKSYPMVYYALGYFNAQMGDAAAQWYAQAAAQPADLCFPVRLEEQIILEAACVENPKDSRAPYYLGNLYYDKKQYDKARAAWDAATRLDPSFAISWRNLSIALYNKHGNKEAAKTCYQKALAANPHDPRLLMEYDQLYCRLGVSPAERLAVYERHADLVDRRDDLSVDFAALYNQTGQPEKALQVLISHQFHPWEGGEGQAATQYALAHALLGQAALDKGDASRAVEHFDSAQHYPSTLGVGRAMHTVNGLIFYFTGLACEALGRKEDARLNFEKVLASEAEGAMWQPYSWLTYYAALALKKLGKDSDAQTRLKGLQDFATQRLNAEDDGGFFTSVPATMVFEPEPGWDTKIWGNYLIGLANKGLGNLPEARKAFESVLELDPYHWETLRELDGLA